MRLIGLGRLERDRCVPLLVGNVLLILGLTSTPVRAQPASTASMKDAFGGTAIDSMLWITTKNLASATEIGGTLN